MDSSLAETAAFTPLSGSCICGACTFTITGPPIQAILCHCGSCKRWSGSSFSANIIVPKQHFSPNESASHVTMYAENSIQRAFCTTCGSCVYVKRGEEDPVAVPRGTIEGIESLKGLEPTVEYFCVRKEKWVGDLGMTEKKERMVE